MQPPVAEPKPVTTTHHGRERIDAYDWLRAKDDPAVLAYLEAENVYTEERTAHLADLRGRIFDEIKARTQETDLSVPVRNRGYWWYSRSFEGKEYGASCRVPVTDPDDWTPPSPAEDAAPDRPALPGEEVLLDLNELAEGHEFFSMGGSSLSLDGRILAYSTDTTGDERFTVRFTQLQTGELLDDTITGVLGGVTWARDGSCYYTTVDDSWRSDKVWRHVLGTAASEDELVFHEPDGRFWVGVGRTRSNRFLVIAAGSKTTSEYRFLDQDAPDEGWRVFEPRSEGVEYSLEHAVIGGDDVFLVLHNSAGADFEIGRTACLPTPRADWTPLVAYDPTVRLEDVDAFAGHLVIHQRSAGLTQLRIIELADDALGEDALGEDYLVAFEDEVYTIGSGGSPDFHQPIVRLGYTTMATPPSIYDYDVRDRSLTLRKQSPVLGDYDPDAYEQHRLWATAPDGEQVPISLVCHRDARAQARPVPLLLYGYGAYEASIDPYFSVARLSLLDRGGAFAIAHIRGGGEMGRRWYDDGKLAHKSHTFTDFIACGEHLVETGWTTREHLVAEGGSAGGLLIGAVANLAPDLCGGLVAQVPFVDTLTSMLDPTLPLTITEYEEWGNPTDDVEAYDLIASYAPYDNVASLDYPPILAETSLHDTRVLYVEPAKWIARLRATAVGRRDFLLRTEMSAGHGGVSGRYKSWHDRARTLAWILERMGLSGVNPRVP
ncbi:MAG: S9 family peptidase [Nocardioides sp.]